MTDDFTKVDANHLTTSTPDGFGGAVEIDTLISVGVQARFVSEAWEGLDDAFIEEIQTRYTETATSGSAGIDLRYVGSDTLYLHPGQQIMISTGLAIYLKHQHFVGLAVPRSGRGSEGLVLGNTIGIIDSDYQNEIKLCLWNRGNKELTIEPGERVAQYFAIERLPLHLNLVEEFDEATERGLGGFGSSGRW